VEFPLTTRSFATSSILPAPPSEAHGGLLDIPMTPRPSQTWQQSTLLDEGITLSYVPKGHMIQMIAPRDNSNRFRERTDYGDACSDNEGEFMTLCGPLDLDAASPCRTDAFGEESVPRQGESASTTLSPQPTSMPHVFACKLKPKAGIRISLIHDINNDDGDCPP